MMTISIGDIIALIALLVGLQAAFSGVYFFYIQNQNKKIVADIRLIDRNSFFVKQMANHITESLISFRIAIEFHSSMIDRLLQNYPMSKENLARIHKAFSDDYFRMEKALVTLMIFTENRRRRESSFKQLGERFGDSDTLKSLEALLEYETKQKQELEHAIDTLRKRINKTLNDSLVDR